jgi:pimeloyl-ACP methyl ester carboxylesterase
VALEQRHSVRIPAGQLGYRETGSGVPVLLLHGLVANGQVWRHVAAALSQDVRCIAPDLPMGSHSPALPDADLSLHGQARIVIDLADALGLAEFVVIGNGYGGDIAQVLATRYPERVRALVLIATNAFDSDPWPTRALRLLLKMPGSRLMASLSPRSRFLQRLPLTYGWAAKRPIPSEIMDAYLRPLARDHQVADDFRRFLDSLSPASLAEVSPLLAHYPHPALVVWPTEDRVFPADGARRLAETIPNARWTSVPDSYSWVPEDQPEVLAGLLGEFLRSHGFTTQNR